MFLSDEVIRQSIVTPDGEEEFQVRYNRWEQAGVLTTRSGKSWFILDSKDFWYDLIQEEYPAKKRCRCKNDFFHLSFAYTPRLHTEDYREVELTAFCTTCGKAKNLGTVTIDYSPSSQLFAQPLTFCPEPKLKCKTYSVNGYWTEKNLLDLSSFLLARNPRLYCWYFDPGSRNRCFREITAEELNLFLFEGMRFIYIFFSWEPINSIHALQTSDSQDVYVEDSVWRRGNIIKFNCPLRILGYGDLYSMDFCSEYIDQDCQLKPKSESFSQLVQELQAYCKKILHQK